MQRYVFCALATAWLANGAFLRSPHSGEKPASQVHHLLQDVEESVRKTGEDAEMVFATLYTYDGQLDASLKKEMGNLNQTLAKLLRMQGKYSTDLDKSHAKFAHLGTTAHDSQQMATKYETGTAQTRSRLVSLQKNVEMLISLLKHAGVTSQGKLVTPEVPDSRGEPARVYSAVRRLLAANSVLKILHPSVYAAFLPSKVAADSQAQQRVVRMTVGLLQETIRTLTAISERLRSTKSVALVQFESLHRRFAKEAVSAGASAQAQQGVAAENEQQAAEVTFSIRFTKSVLTLDQKFSEAVEAHVKSNAELIYASRDLRQAQLKILRDLTGILSAEGSIAAPAVSFLETRAETKLPGASLVELQTESGAERFRSEVEAAIQNHGDTHSILMRIKGMLDDRSSVDIVDVRSTIAEMEDALRSLEGDQDKIEEAKRGCESQKFHATAEEDTLKANLALMTASHDHAQKAVMLATNNVKGIEKKVKALETSSADFARVSRQAITHLEGQSHDRTAIMMAVRKATEIVGPHLPAGVSAAELMQSLLQDITAQETKESIYRENQARFQSEFEHYVQDYIQLLKERRRHYQSTLGVLQLHVSELASDLLAQKQTLNTGDELVAQSKGLCESVMKFYEKHTKLRTDLSVALRSILPNMPTVLSNDDGSSPGQL